LINSGRRGKLDRLLEGYGDSRGLAEEEGIITAIPKNKAENHHIVKSSASSHNNHRYL